MLRNAWIIPVVPVVSFWLILFFGKKLPKKGGEIGVATLGLCLLLSLVLAGQWISREGTVPVVHHGEEEHSVVDVDEHGKAVAPDDAHAEEKGDDHGTTATTEDHPLTADEHGGEVQGGGEHGEDAELKRAPVERTFTWWQNGHVRVTFGSLVDGLSVAILLMVSIISLLVHIFSMAYMHGDRRFTHYYAALSLFTSGMFILVTAPSTLQMLLGWEIMGLCSFMLIGHWWEEQENSDAALKAFFTTRTGDIGLLVGVSMLFFLAGESFDVMHINEAALAGDMPSTALTVAAACLLLAVVGKSAQFPLHTWLPDAMAGPTPVSAMIHAATMVVAGVFLVARLYGVFWEGFHIGAGDGYSPVAMVGGLTILIAAALAFVQADIKKVLAYSTVSQLGYMVMALGVGAWTAAVFHVVTHAFFKAGLFLGAGSVAHSGSHHSFDMKQDMGGLRRHMPVTFATFLVCSLALAGIFPLAGFWSKDEILLGAGENGYEAFMYVGLVGAFMTAAYMTRCIWLTFFGEPRGAAAHHHPHESPKLITVPLVILAALAVVSGFLNAPGVLKFTEWFEPAFVSNVVTHHDFSVTTAIVGSAVGLAGIAVAYLWYWRNAGPQGVTDRVGPLRAGYRLLANRYYLDHLYTGVVVGSIKGPIARAAYWTNQRILDGLVNAAGITMRVFGRFTYEFLDQKVVDGVVNGAGVTAEESGAALRTIQTGRVQQYAAVLFGAVAVLGLALVLTA
ncbi:MAG TPA: NADH-quinone oxidoreductase subunit L [Acidimicrobiales bacterium]|nr:NADH-quinone oxidoreductase subunit L [Acidimicrobiales bacterium]